MSQTIVSADIESAYKLDLFRHPELLSDATQLINDLQYRTRLVTYFERTRAQLGPRQLESNALNKCAPFIRAVNDSVNSDGFYLEVSKLSLQELAFCSISFSERQVQMIRHSFKASHVRAYIKSQQISGTQRQEIFRRLDFYCKEDEDSAFRKIYDAARHASKSANVLHVATTSSVELSTTQSTESPAYRQRSLTPDVSAHDTPSVASLESRKRKWSPAQDQSMPIYEDKEQSQHHILKTTCSQSRLSPREEPRPPSHDNRGEGQSSMRQSPQPATQSSCTNLVADIQPRRRIEYMYSNGPADRVDLSGTLFSKAIAASNQREMERSLGESTTGCVTVLVPEGMNEDISITLWVGRKEGFRIVDAFKLTPAWSIPPKHQEPPP